MPSTRSPLARPDLADVGIYETGKMATPINLADNTNLWGPAPNALRAYREAAADALSNYPSPYGERLKEAAARYTGLPVECVATGNGSNDLLDSSIRAFARPGDLFVCLDPTFGMARAFARLNGLQVAGVPGLPGGRLDLDRLLQAAPRILYLVAPNNPTGALASRADLDAAISRCPGLAIVDEAYFEYAGATVADLVPSAERLVVTRTLSKAFGLAGLRIGFALAAPGLVREIERSRGPYTLTAAAERAGAAALTQDLEWVRERVREAVEARDRLAAALRRVDGLVVHPSATNFLLLSAHPGGRPITELADRLGAAGIEVRRFERLTGIGDAVRITVGPWPVMERLLAALGRPETVGATESGRR